MSGENVRLLAARTALEAGDVGPLLALALTARAEQDRGNYCECAEPITEGLDLMCGACLLNNRGQEIARVHSNVDAHQFVLNEDHKAAKFMGWCVHCTHDADDPRHNGVGVVGHTSWGETVQGASA